MHRSLEEREAQAKASLKAGIRSAREALLASRAPFSATRAEQFRHLQEAAAWRNYASIWPAELRHLRETFRRDLPATSEQTPGSGRSESGGNRARPFGSVAPGASFLARKDTTASALLGGLPVQSLEAS